MSSVRMQPIINFVIDPPWPKKKGGLRAVRPTQTRSLDYSTMSIVEIFDLLDREIFPMAAPSHNVFLWGIDQFLFEGERMMLERGVSESCSFRLGQVQRDCPSVHVRYSHEYLTWFYKPKLVPIAIEQRGKFTTVIREPRREHSRKPNAAYNMIEALYPRTANMDVFSRERRQGWGQFGDQTNHIPSSGVFDDHQPGRGVER